ncbi:MAG TPA: signal peptide peptidase SppA [Pirellulaceae bacterium]|nr:signal peptide peptidase SppA [Pirellulaceae bacterium]
MSEFALPPAGSGTQSSSGSPSQVILVQRSSGMGLLMLALGWFGFLTSGALLALLVGGMIYVARYVDPDGLEEKNVANWEEGEYKIAVITIDGVIGDADEDGYVLKQIQRVRKDESVRAIVVRVDSPGGVVSGADYILHHLRKLKKEKGVPMVVSMGGMAASGGYYVSMAVEDQDNSIFAEPTCVTGSIGVIMPHYDISGLLARFDVKDDSIVTHERKQMLAMTKPIPPEHREIIQKNINEMFARFKKIVQEGRPKFAKDPAALDVLATGEVFTADQAVANGLIDKVGFLEDALERAVELAKLNKSEVQAIRFKRPISMFDDLSLIQSRAKAPGSIDLSLIQDLATPRAYYLYTTLPTTMSSRAR